MLSVNKAIEEAVTRARIGNGPSLIECKTYRWHGHYEGDPQVYRKQEELVEWKKKDPIVLFKAYLTGNEKIDINTILEIEKEVQQEIIDAVQFAKDSPESQLSDALEDVFA